MNEVEEFIKRRFPIDCNWISGNCYFFAIILQDRFPGGSIYYDVIEGHFIYKYYDNYYDWTGRVSVDETRLVEWDKFDEYDQFQRARIVRDCIK
jgi:hypothetical protein